MITEHFQRTFHVHHSHKCLHFIAQVVHYIAYQTGGAQEVFCHECHVNGKLGSDEWSTFYWVCTTLDTMGTTGNNNDACSLESWFLWNYFSANQSLNSQKNNKKGKVQRKAKSRNHKRTLEVIAAFCYTDFSMNYSIQLCLLPILRIQMPPGIMIYHNMNRVHIMNLLWGWKGACLKMFKNRAALERQFEKTASGAAQNGFQCAIVI